MPATFTVKPGAPSNTFEVWLPSGRLFHFQPTPVDVDRGPELVTNHELDHRELLRRTGSGGILNVTGTTDPYEAEERLIGMRVKKSTGELYDENGDPIPVASGAEVFDGKAAVWDEAAGQWVATAIDTGIDPAPAVQIKALPNHLNNVKWWNGQPNQNDPIVTRDGVQYVAWWDKSYRPIIAKREVPGGEWQVVNLDRLVGQPLGRVDGNFGAGVDNHNFLSIGVDGAGRVHVAGNYHGDPLRYIRSGANGDIRRSSWTTGTMIGTQETNMSYPCFVPLNNGGLLFTYRDGGSGSGDTFLNRWDNVAGTWSRVGMLFAGKAASTGEVVEENFYPDHTSCGADGTVHIMGTWRTGGALSDQTNDLVYIRSTDNGTTWKSIAGASLTLPIEHSTSPVILDTIPEGSGLQSTTGFDVDTLGRPHGAHLRYDSNGYTQVYHDWWDGSAWHFDQVTSLTTTEDLDQPLTYGNTGRPIMVCGADGGCYIVFRSLVDGRRGSIRMIDVTPGRARREFSIANLDVYYGEFGFDTRAARERNQLNLLLTPTAPQNVDLAALPQAGDGTAWGSQWGAVLTVDLGQVDAIASGHIRLPRLRTIDRSTQTALSTSGTSLANLGTAVTLSPVHMTSRSKLVVARLRVRASITGGGTGRITLNQSSSDGQAAAMLGQLTGSVGVVGTTVTTYELPWVPVQQMFRAFPSGGTIFAQASVSAGTMTVQSMDLEYGLIEDTNGAAVALTAARRPPTELEDFSAPLIVWDPNQPSTDTNAAAQQYVYDSTDVQDQSGYNLSQSTSGNRATLVKPSIGTYNALRFDGSNDSYSNASPVNLATGTAFTLYAVITGLTVPASGRAIVHTIGHKVGGRQMVITTAGKLEFQKAKTATIGTGTTTLTSAAAVLLISYNTDGSWAINVNGHDDITGTTVTTWVDGELHLGYQANDGNSYLQADLALAGVLPEWLNTARRLQFAQILGARYGITIAA